MSIKKPLTANMMMTHLKGIVTIGYYALDQSSDGNGLYLGTDDEEEFPNPIQTRQWGYC